MIKLKQIVLRGFKVTDKYSLSQHANNSNISKWLTDRFPNPYTLDDAVNWINRTASQEVDLNLGIEYNTDIIGSIGIALNNDLYRCTGEVGYWLAEPYWNCGFASEALAGFTDYCFRNLKVNRIYARVFETNFASEKVLKKCGFTFQCILKKEIIKNGQIINAKLYDKINTVTSI